MAYFFDEILPAINNLFNNPDFSPDMNILAEIKPGSTSALGSDEIHEIVTITGDMAHRSRPGKTALIVSDDADYGVFHVLEFLLKNKARELVVLKLQLEAKKLLC